MRIAGWMVVLAATAATGGCGGGADGGQGVADVPPPVEVSIAGRAVVKVRTASGAWAALVEKLRPVENVTQPDRRLQIASAGGTAGATYVPPPGWLLIDFALHPTRQISVVLANARELRLLRLDREGRVLTEFDFVDPLAADDPFMDDPIYLRDPTAMVPFNTRDAARLAAIGEDVAMAIRTGRNAVVAYRYRYTANGFDRMWRTLVEPGVVIGNSGIIGGG
ncbi:MAG TPA: hypothetical protein VFN64_13390, partial [Burkholderiaceae bacterium]|nr:hypothetical protein [Burkholderiaceae bacterium]